MVVDSSRARRELEEVAFGRVVTPEDQSAAAQALQALRDLDDRGASPALEPVIVELADHSRAAASQAMSHDDWSGTRSRFTETLRRLWVVPLVVASIAVGAIGGAAATRAVEKPQPGLAPVAQATAVPSYSTAPSDTSVAADPVVPDPSSDAVLASAENMLDQPRLPADRFPDQQRLIDFGIDPSSTHFVRVAEEDGTTSVWIARAVNGRLCLVLLPYNDSFRMACTEQERFAKNGVLVFTGEGIDASWDASGVSTFRRSTD
jgi:hypothetical protein